MPGLVPDIHETRRDLRYGPWMAGPEPGHERLGGIHIQD
jgi:hypothetical protein